MFKKTMYMGNGLKIEMTENGLQACYGISKVLDGCNFLDPSQQEARENLCILQMEQVGFRAVLSGLKIWNSVFWDLGKAGSVYRTEDCHPRIYNIILL